MMKKDNVNNITGSIISDLRKSQGWTQKQFAKVFNVSEGSIAHYEQGVTIPNIELLQLFADYFHVNIDYLLGRCMLSIEYSKLNDILYGDMTLIDAINIITGLTKDKKHYLCQTLSLLNDKKESLK